MPRIAATHVRDGGAHASIEESLKTSDQRVEHWREDPMYLLDGVVDDTHLLDVEGDSEIEDFGEGNSSAASLRVETELALAWDSKTSKEKEKLREKDHLRKKKANDDDSIREKQKGRKRFVRGPWQFDH